jgi:hypothetical protein
VVVVVVWVAGWLRHAVVQACWKCLRPVLYIIDNTWAVDGLAPKVLDSQVGFDALTRPYTLINGGQWRWRWWRKVGRSVQCRLAISQAGRQAGSHSGHMLSATTCGQRPAWGQPGTRAPSLTLVNSNRFNGAYCCTAGQLEHRAGGCRPPPPPRTLRGLPTSVRVDPPTDWLHDIIYCCTSGQLEQRA